MQGPTIEGLRVPLTSSPCRGVDPGRCRGRRRSHREHNIHIPHTKRNAACAGGDKQTARASRAYRCARPPARGPTRPHTRASFLTQLRVRRARAQRLACIRQRAAMPTVAEGAPESEELPPPNLYMYSSTLCAGWERLPPPRQQLAPDQDRTGSSALSSVVTVVVCTSPIPSHPSSALLDATLESFALCTGGLQYCRTVVVCDGCIIDEANPHSKWGRVTAAQRSAYDAFKATLRRKASSTSCSFEVIELTSHHGFARAVLAAVESAVRTELCLVVQHDWLFVSPGFDALGAAEAMLQHPGVLPYVGAMSLSTVGYRERANQRYGVDIEPATLSIGSLRFLPLLMLQDKPFLAQRQWLCELCSATPLGKFPEDTVGQIQLNGVRASGLQAREAHRLHRTYFLRIQSLYR